VNVKRFLATLGVMLSTSLVLVAFDSITRPDVRVFRSAITANILGSTLAAGVLFSLLNATMEEFIFRGVLFDALRSQWSVTLTVVFTSLLFGLGHLRGYPPGTSGALLAVVFGAVMALLRVWTGGLAMSVLAHVGADATIFWLIHRSDSV
jgi:membrane protease YdiL (CAAX protease family)